MLENKIPYFIKQRGCTNCNTLKEYKKDHKSADKIQTICIDTGCMDYGFSLYRPFIDPQELTRIDRRVTEKQKIRERNYLKRIREKFGDAYEKIGINLDDVIHSLNKILSE